MWIRVQDEKILVDPKIIQVTKGILKKSKYTIAGKVTNSTEEIAVNLGVYDSEEIAQRVFEEIEQAILSDKKIYVMPESNIIY
ncbi:Uncharacterised protein [uncultured Clostridium sp.]|uniref:hypothetical protein n=1 Tax=uncultured Clostridium sp. TaxID=59620 RepID=UPI000820BDCB|nr:hypothetical protein [uncultured Clostridium sp.]SCI73718.1 Uncharacterised protein [uncultured Clostridium sp.]